MNDSCKDKKRMCYLCFSSISTFAKSTEVTSLKFLCRKDLGEVV